MTHERRNLWVCGDVGLANKWGSGGIVEEYKKKIERARTGSLSGFSFVRKKIFCLEKSYIVGFLDSGFLR